MFKKFVLLLLFGYGMPGILFAQQKRPPIWEADLQYKLLADTINIESIKDIRYQKEPDSFTTLDIYKPALINSATLLPVVILIHGGPVMPGIPVKPKDWKVYRAYGRLLASNGMAGVIINHRIHDKDNIEQSRNDVLAAIDFIKTNAGRYGLNQNSIGLWMFSLGGKHFDFFSRQQDTGIKAIISYYGVLTTGKSNPDSVKHIPAQLIVRCGLDQPELLAATDAYIAEAVKLNFPIEIVNYNKGVHAFDIFQQADETTRLINRAIDFLKTSLNLSGCIKSPVVPLRQTGK